LPRELDAPLNAIIPSELLFLGVEAIETEIASMEVLIRVSSKSSSLLASFRVGHFVAILLLNYIYAYSFNV
jgi:hypothetical protein